ncbi:hypothetical protein MTO96_022309 [Rhipicephalus appendiculatus]
MGSTILLVVVLAAIGAVAPAPTIIKDGEVASAAFRGEWASAATPQPWHDDDASGAAKRRRHESPAFDQIIVETVEQPARHRPSLVFILFVIVTSLFIGAIALLLCVLCLLKAFNAQIAYRSVAQKDDTFCVVENRGRPLANVMFKQRPDYEDAEAPIARKEREVAQSARDLPRSARDGTKTAREGTKSVRDVKYSTRDVLHSVRDAPVHSARDVPAYNAPTGDYWEPPYSRDMQQYTREGSNRRRGAYKSSAKVHHRNELYSDDEDVEEHNCGKALSNLRLDLRINQEPGRKNKNVHGGGVIRQYPMESYSPPSYSSGEDTNISRVSKSRPLLFSLNPDKKQAKDHGSKTSIRDAKTHKVKGSSPVRPSGSKDSQVSEVDEHFFGEQNASETFWSTTPNSKAGRPPSRNTEPTPRKASTTPHLGRTTPQPEDVVRQHIANATDQLTLDQVKALIDEILNKKANKKGKDGS